MKISCKKGISVLPLILITSIIYCQDLVKAKGTAQMEIPFDKSRLETNTKLREMAMVDALEKAFGRVIVQGNATYITNLQTGQEVKTNMVFNTIANSSVKGEVQRVLSEEFTDIETIKTIDREKVKITEIRCDIEIMAREIVTPPVAFTSFPLACPDDKCKTTSFKSNDKLYYFFTSPVSGYLTVYLDDSQYSQCLLPHIYMESGLEGGVPVEADKIYYLFTDVDYFLFINNIQEMNRVFIIFSKNPLNKPSLSTGVLMDEKGFLFPKSLSSEDFQRWLNTYRSFGKDNVQVAIEDIVITK